MAAVGLTMTARANTYPNDLDLSRASDSKIVQVAQADAKDFWIRIKANTSDIGAFEINQYEDGRAIKHGLMDFLKAVTYTNAFGEVLTQLRIDGE